MERAAWYHAPAEIGHSCASHFHCERRSSDWSQRSSCARKILPLILQAPQDPESAESADAATARPTPQTANPNAPPNRLATSQGFMLPGNSLTEMIDILGKMLKIKYILDPRVKGSVTLYTYGEVKDVELMPLLQTILRVNGAAIVLVGDLYRIVPINTISNLPLSPMMNADPKTLPDDERMVLNLIFLKYTMASEMDKLLKPFYGEGAGSSRVRAGQSADPAGQRTEHEADHGDAGAVRFGSIRGAAGAPLRDRKQPALRPGQRAGDRVQGIRSFGKELSREVHPGGPDQHADRGGHQPRRFRRRGEVDREAGHPGEDHRRLDQQLCLPAEIRPRGDRRHGDHGALQRRPHGHGHDGQHDEPGNERRRHAGRRDGHGLGGMGMGWAWA